MSHFGRTPLTWKMAAAAVLLTCAVPQGRSQSGSSTAPSARSGPIVPPAELNRALAAWQLCQRSPDCDGYSQLRALEREAGRDASVRRQLAREYLRRDLPWRVTALTDKTDPTAQKSMAALRMIGEDASRVAPRDAAGNESIAERLWLLLGIPSEAVSGPMAELPNEAFTPNTDWLDDDADEPEVEDRTDPSQAAAVFRPSLRALYQRGFRPDVEKEYTAPTVRRGFYQRLGATASDIDRWVSRADQELSTGDNGPGSAALVQMLYQTRNAIGDGSDLLRDPNEWKLSGIKRADQGYLVTFGSSIFGSAALLLRRAASSYLAFSFACEGALSATLANVDEQEGEELVLRQLWRSDNSMAVSIFYPRRNLVQTIASDDGLLNQKVSFIELDGDASPEIVVNGASYGFERFGSCTVCPHKRSGYLLDLDPRTRLYRAVGSFNGGADEYGWGGSGLLVSPLAAVYSVQTDTRRLIRAAQHARSQGSASAMRTTAAEAIGLAATLQNGGLVQEAAVLMRAVLREAKLAGADRKTLDEVRIGLGQALVLAANPQEAYSILKSAQVPSNPGARKHMLSLLGLAAMETQNLEDALNYWDQSRLEGQDTTVFGSNRALLYYHIGAWSAAKEQAERLIPMAMRNNNQRSAGIAMILLADLAAREGDRESAVDWLARAIRMSGSTDDAPIKATALKMAASVALELHRPRLAEALLEDALYRYDAATWTQGGASFMLLYGRLFELEGRGADAFQAYRTAALVASKSGGLDPVQAWAEVGRLSARMGKPDVSLDAYTRAFASVLRGRRQTPTEAFKLQFLQNVESVPEVYFARLRRASAAPVRIANDLEAWKFKVFSDVYGPGGLATSNAAEQLRARLNPGEVYVSYFVGIQTSFAAVITQDRISVRNLRLKPAGARKLRNDILSQMDVANPTARAYISSRRMPRELDRSLDRAHRLLIEPLGIPSDTHTLIISADEDLSGIPWAALPVSPASWWEDLRWMIGLPRISSLLEEFEIVLTPSAEVALVSLAAPSRASEKGSRLVVAAAGEVSPGEVAAATSLLTDPRARALPPLRAAGSEAVAVSRALQPSILLADSVAGRGVRTSGTANRSAILSRLPQSQILHFIGHGVFNTTAPMSSSLFLDQSAPDGERRLTAADLAKLDLRNLEFVALSACETGRATAETGAESFGFLRALLAARAQGTLLMGWQVDDRSTAAFYDTFYRNYDAGPSSAYRSASLALKDRYKHPFYWAAGGYYGRWR